MHIKYQDKNQVIFIKHVSWQSEEKTHMYDPHQSPIYLTWISLTNSIILELWKLHSCLFKIKRNRKIILKSNEKFMKVFAWKKKATSLLKTRFLVTLNLKERWKVVELNKYLTTGSGIKTIREKTGFLEFIWKLESRKLFENWSPGK